MKQIPENLCESMFEDIVYEFVLLHADAIIRTQSFLLMIIHRHRYRKLKQAASIIQNRCKHYLAKTTVKRLKQEKVDEDRRQRLDKHLQIQQLQKDRAELIETSAIRIQSLYHLLKFKNELKSMRAKMKSLPYVCRSSFVKMQMLKMSTCQLVTDTSSKLVHNRK